MTSQDHRDEAERLLRWLNGNNVADIQVQLQAAVMSVTHALLAAAPENAPQE